MINITKMSGLVDTWRLSGFETVGYVVVRNGKSLFIDCPAGITADLLADAGIAMPDLILHTQVQSEHCYEWESFSDVPVYVAESAREVALISDEYLRESKTVWPPDRGWDNRGEEKYGVGGCITERPPVKPLNIAGLLNPGQQFKWQDIDLQVIELPGSGKRSIGLYWQSEEVVFSGDLLYAGGYAVNLHDLERSYGILSGYEQAVSSLRKIADLSPRFCLPSTGPVISDVQHDISRLITLLENPCRVSPLRGDRKWQLTGFKPIREIGTRWRENFPGVYQNSNFGNMILFIDDEGRGLAIDPDICVWDSWDACVNALNSDLDLLEKEAGLKSVEYALVTHYHGDHFQNAPELRKRYNTRVAATSDVADVMARPENYPYPCLVNWYGFPFENLSPDDILKYNQVFNWNSVEIIPVHTPGHCYGHTGFLIEWNGMKIFCAGDVLQYGDGAIGAGLPVLYNDTAWPDRGYGATLQKVIDLKPDYILGGHSHAFKNTDNSILRDMLTAQRQAEENLRQLIIDGDILRAMTPPNYDALRMGIE